MALHNNWLHAHSRLHTDSTDYRWVRNKRSHSIGIWFPSKSQVCTCPNNIFVTKEWEKQAIRSGFDFRLSGFRWVWLRVLSFGVKGWTACRVLGFEAFTLFWKRWVCPGSWACRSAQIWSIFPGPVDLSAGYALTPLKFIGSSSCSKLQGDFCGYTKCLDKPKLIKVSAHINMFQ